MQHTVQPVYMRHGLPLAPELGPLKTLPTTHLQGDSSLARYLAPPCAELTTFSELCDTLIEKRVSAPESRNSRSSTPSGRSSRPAPVRLAEPTEYQPSEELVCGTPLNLLYERKVASARALMGQMEVSLDRHKGLKGYLKDLRGQLGHNSQLACAELQAKRDAIVGQLDAYIHESTKSVQMTIKEKERFLSGKEQELDIVIEELAAKENILKLATTAEAKSKFVQDFSQHMEQAESALKLWVADCQVSAAWVDIKAPVFPFALTMKDPKPPMLLERDVNRDQTSIPVADTRIGTADKPVLPSHSHRHHHHKGSKVPKLNLTPSQDTSEMYENSHVHAHLMHQNKKLMQRLEYCLDRKLENTLNTKLVRKTKEEDCCSEATKTSDIEPAEGSQVSISTLITEYSEL